MISSLIRSVAVVFMTFATVDSVAITVEECCQMARDNYPEVRRMKLIERTKDFTMHNIATQWLPQISVSGQASWQNNAGDILEVFTPEGLIMLENALRDVKPIKKWQYQAGIDLAQNVWDGGATKVQKEIAAADAEIQQKDIETQLYALDGRVEEVFFSILLMESRLDQTNVKLDMLSENRQKIHKMFVNGTVAETEADILEVEEMVSKQQQKVLTAKINMYREMLTLLTGSDMTAMKLQRPDMPRVYPTPSEIRADYAMLDAQANRQMLELKRLNVNLMPKVALFGQAYYGYPDMNVFRSMTDDGMSFNLKVGLRVSWNFSELYTRGRSQRIIAHRLNEINIKRDMLDYDNRLANVMLTPEIQRLEATLADDQRVIELRKKIRMSAETKLNNGIVDATELRQKIVDETNAVQDLELHTIELLKTAYQLRHNGLPSLTQNN